MKVTVIFTCFNRKEKSLKCMKTLVDQDSGIEHHFIVVDDNSSDGTAEALLALGNNVELLHGSGSLFWAGGMRKGINAYLESGSDSDYVLLVNDDVEFSKGIINKLIAESKEKMDAVIVGATCDDSGAFTYGAMQLIVPRKKDLYRQVSPAEGNVECDTFNCNCVLLSDAVIRKAGNFDPIYTHSLADIDYGLRLRKLGFHIYSSEEYVGVCNKNSIKGTWADGSLSRRERLKKKESPKGAPTKQWFYFLKKNFGLFAAVKGTVTPYLRILIRK